MSMGAFSDGFMAGCHVVAKIPAVGVAICLTGAAVYTDILPVTLGDQQVVSAADNCGGPTQVLIDTERFAYEVDLGDCLSVYDVMTREELRLRCMQMGMSEEEFCRQF